MFNLQISIKNFEVTHPNYQCITALRCLYQKQFDPEKWKKLELLQSHCEERKNTEKIENDRLFVVRFIHTFFGLEKTFTEEEILKVCGLVMVSTKIANFRCVKIFGHKKHIDILVGNPLFAFVPSYVTHFFGDSHKVQNSHRLSQKRPATRFFAYLSSC